MGRVQSQNIPLSQPRDSDIRSDVMGFFLCPRPSTTFHENLASSFEIFPKRQTNITSFMVVTKAIMIELNRVEC